MTRKKGKMATEIIGGTLKMAMARSGVANGSSGVMEYWSGGVEAFWGIESDGPTAKEQEPRVSAAQGLGRCDQIVRRNLPLARRLAV